MSYFSELDIDTRTCGQADEDAWLDLRDGIVTRARVFSGLAAERHSADYAARPAFSTLTPAQRATELVARMELAKRDRNKTAFLAAQAELKTLVEQM